MKGSLLDSQATVFADPDAASVPIAIIAEGQQIEVSGVATQNNQRWMAAVLPDGRQGYLPAATRIYGFHTTQLVRDTNVHAEPSETSAVRVRFGKGATLLIIGVTNREGRRWFRVLDGDHEEGYIVADHSTADRRRISPAEAASQRARRNMIVGGAWCAGGTAVTIITYAAASGGGTYVVAWGAIVFGGWRFLKGLAGLGDA